MLKIEPSPLDSLRSDGIVSLKETFKVKKQKTSEFNATGSNNEEASEEIKDNEHIFFTLGNADEEKEDSYLVESTKKLVLHVWLDCINR